MFELLLITDERRERIVQRRSAADLHVARKDGSELIHEGRSCKVLAGMTTVEELVRLTKTDAAAVV